MEYKMSLKMNIFLKNKFLWKLRKKNFKPIEKLKKISLKSCNQKLKTNKQNLSKTKVLTKNFKQH